MAIVGWGRVEVLLRFDLSLSRAKISHDKILKKLKMGVLIYFKALSLIVESADTRQRWNRLVDERHRSAGRLFPSFSFDQFLS